MNRLDLYAPAIQALAALLTFAVTAFLARVTYLYMKATAAALKLSRDQFEREWHPDVHVRAAAEASSVFLEVTNLGRMAIVVTVLHVRFPDVGPQDLVTPISRPFPLASGARDTLPMSLIEVAMRQARLTNLIGNTTVEILLGFAALGTKHDTKWFRFLANVERGMILDLVSIP
jgi:hypothetical protein